MHTGTAAGSLRNHALPLFLVHCLSLLFWGLCSDSQAVKVNTGKNCTDPRYLQPENLCPTISNHGTVINMPNDNIEDEDDLKICKMNIIPISAAWSVVAQTSVCVCVCLLIWQDRSVIWLGSQSNFKNWPGMFSLSPVFSLSVL